MAVQMAPKTRFFSHRHTDRLLVAVGTSDSVAWSHSRK